MSTNLRNLFGTVVHDVPQGTSPVELRQLFGTVVHSVPDGTSPVELRQLFGTVVHDVPDGTSPVELRQLFGTAVHDVNIPFNVFDITGTVGVTASFDASTQGYDSSSYHYQWSWQTVPGGSTISNAILPLPDGASTFPVNGNTGLYHFDDETANDSSGRGNDGTVDGATPTTDSYIGTHAYSFDGNNDRITLTNPDTFEIDGGNSKTIAFWASASAWVDNDAFFGFGANSSGEDFTFLQRSGPDLQLNLWAGDLRVSAIETIGWNHYFVIYDSDVTTSYIYQNNQLLGSLERTLNTDNSNPVTIGNGFGIWGGSYFGGVIDEFAIWNRALNAAERDVIYNFLQTGSAIAAVGSSDNLLEQFSFVPDVTGTYYMDLEIVENSSGYSLTGTVSASVGESPGPGPEPGPLPPIISGSNPTTELITANQLGYSINTYNIDLLSVQRTRRVKQIPFRLGGKGIQSLRLRPNTEITGSS